MIETCAIATTTALEPPPVLAALAALLTTLEDEEIQYCQWKSTGGLPKALQGRTDLDLLVGRSDIHRFHAILGRHDFKRLISHPSRSYPAIEDYLGCDFATGRLIHLHVHYRVVLGEEYIKNFYPPLERGLLENTGYTMGVRIPAPELEAIVLSLRTLLKYRDRDALRDTLRLGHTGGIPNVALEELERLLVKTTPESIAEALARYASFLSPELVPTFLETIGRDPRDGPALYRLRGQVRHQLAAYRLRSSLRASLANLWISLGKQWPFDRVIRRLLPQRDRHKTPATGGLTLAFVGADGAGKSTLIKHIAKWLSWRLVVRTYYMGSSRPSAGTWVWKAAGDLAMFTRAGCRRVFGEQSRLTRLAARAELLCNHLRYLGDARDRYHRYMAAQRAVAGGAIVIFDRYPLESIRIAGRVVDGPRIAASVGPLTGRFVARLAEVEEAIYQRIQPPNHVFVLQVSPDVSQLRKPEHPRERIEAKSKALQELAPNRFDLTSIDADQALDRVLLQVKTTLWRLL